MTHRADPDDADHDIDPEQGSQEHHVPGDLLELYEVLEWQAAVEAAKASRITVTRLPTLTPEVGTFVSRSGWGARPSRGVTRLDNPAGVTFHWEGPRMGAFPHESCATKVRGIQAFHMDARGWTDIAYNEVVCPHGVVYDGRGRGVRSAANGTNLGNGSSVAVCALVGQGDPQPSTLFVGMLAARRYLREGGTGSAIWSHRDWKSTECPGLGIYEWVRAGCPDPTPPTRPEIPQEHPVTRSPSVAIAWTPTGAGYAVLFKDGGIANYGDCPPLSTFGAEAPDVPAVDLSLTPDGLGVAVVYENGKVHTRHARHYGEPATG